MRALLLSLLIPLMAACSTMTTSSPVMPSASPIEMDVSGHWTGSWIGTGLFNSPREDAVTLDLRQQGYVGYGRLVLEGTTAAESVPWEIRREGLAGIRVGAEIMGGEIHVRHELGGRLFAADFTLVSDDRMVGHVRGTAPDVQLVLTRAAHREAPQARALPVTPAPEPTPAEPEPLARIEPAPPEPEPVQEPDPVQYASTLPVEEPQQADPAPERPRIEEFTAVPELKVVLFDFDKSSLRPDAADAVQGDADWLKENADTVVLIEGHCDELGTTEYNQALGDRRAQAVRESLEAAGIEADRLTTISYGKEKPTCTENTDECRAQNRHVEFKVKSK
ncbi:MAG TPA: peptidoglycan-associated lipoprotein Pal [Methylomirabilota bacterium]|nr:peptidoglycan-associated lipoprotein Pal [Methylomirabilota bacterium]